MSTNEGEAVCEMLVQHLTNAVVLNSDDNIPVENFDDMFRRIFICLHLCFR